jgi:hypothetical protein
MNYALAGQITTVLIVCYFVFIRPATRRDIRLSVEAEEWGVREANAFASQWNRNPRKATHLSIVKGYPSQESYDDSPTAFMLDYDPRESA